MGKSTGFVEISNIFKFRLSCSSYSIVGDGFPVPTGKIPHIVRRATTGRPYDCTVIK